MAESSAQNSGDGWGSATRQHGRDGVLWNKPQWSHSQPNACWFG
ncbi:MAG: hypothetical protein N2C14_27880 [Planctomycetales bacterium]